MMACPCDSQPENDLKPSICTRPCPKTDRALSAGNLRFWKAGAPLGRERVRGHLELSTPTQCLGRMLVPLIPAKDFAGPPICAGPEPRCTKPVPLIVPRGGGTTPGGAIG
jgi:hypothetical protein